MVVIDRSSHSHYTKNTGRSQAIPVGTRCHASTCSGTSNLKIVCAGIHGTDEGHDWLGGDGIVIAKEGYESGLVMRLVRTRRAIRVVQDEFPTTEERFRGFLAVRC